MQNFSDETIAAFNSYESSLNDAVYTYQFFGDDMENLDGDGEKFYPLFYDSVSVDDIVYMFKSRKEKLMFNN